MFDWIKKIFEKLYRYGKDPQFYYKKEEQYKTKIGLSFSILYFAIYIGYFAYKLSNMIKKVDVEYTDSNINPENPDSIHLTNENFYLGFAIEDPISYDTILDETIYYPKAYFKKGKREGKEWIWTSKELEVEPCNLEKFGSKYRDIFAKKYLGLHYCFKKMDEVLEGHFSYDMYSMFFISLFPCINTTENNNKCKPLEVIDYYLKGTFFTMQFQDILLTPNDYNEPVKGRDQDLYTTIGKRLFKEFHVYFKITNIETDLNFIGIDEIKMTREDKFIKYDSFNQMTYLLDEDVYETGGSFCDITLKLSDLVFYQKRKYTKLLNILGDVVGLMEIVDIIFEFINSFIVDILYETSITNELLFEIEQARRKRRLKLKKASTINSNYPSKQLKLKQIKIKVKKSYNKPKEEGVFLEENGVGQSSKNQIEKDACKTTNNNENNKIPNYYIKINIKNINHNMLRPFFCFLCGPKKMEKKIIERRIDIIKEYLDIITIFKKLYQLTEKKDIIKNKAQVTS